MALIIILISIAIMCISFLKNRIVKFENGYCYVISRNAEFYKCLIGDDRLHFINPVTDVIIQTINIGGHELDMCESPLIMRDNIILKLKCNVFFQVSVPEQFTNCDNYPLVCIEMAVVKAFREWANNIKSNEVLMDFSMYPDDSNCQYLNLWQEINESANRLGVQVINIHCQLS